MPTVDIYSKQQVDALIAGAGGLPDPTGASAGDVLTLDSNKDPAWIAPGNSGNWAVVADTIAAWFQANVSIFNDATYGRYYQINKKLRIDVSYRGNIKRFQSYMIEKGLVCNNGGTGTVVTISLGCLDASTSSSTTSLTKIFANINTDAGGSSITNGGIFIASNTRLTQYYDPRDLLSNDGFVLMVES